MTNINQIGEGIETSARYWPNNQSLRDELSLPLTLTFYPLAPDSPKASFSQERVADYRCHSCKAFLNHLCKIRNEREYDCSICGCSNRLNKKIEVESPEMKNHVYEFRAKNLTNRIIDRKERTFMFIIDISNYGKNTNVFLKYTTHLITKFVEERQEQVDTNVAFISFDNCINYYFKSGQEINKIKNTHLEEMDINSHLFSVKKDKQQIKQILQDIEEELTRNQTEYRVKVTKSKALLPSIHEGLRLTQKNSGRIFIVSGINSVPQYFHEGLESQPENWRDNYSLNVKKCIPPKTLQLLNSTYMSVNIYVFSIYSVNLLPLYAMTKMTNGVIRFYSPVNSQLFFYQLQQTLCTENQFLSSETILKVRNTTGLKLVGIFGQYRSHKSMTDQVELLCCPSTRKYIFQFIVEGKIHQNFVNIQFSILWTDKEGNRIFKVITVQNKITIDSKLILSSINYDSVCQSYLQAVFHNMDLNAKTRNLQVTLQQRCRKHLKALKSHLQLFQGTFKDAKPYIILTFLLMRHFVLNTPPQNAYLYDQAIEMRSRTLTTDQGLHIVWPVLYSVNKNGSRIIEMKNQEIVPTQIGLVANQGDYCHVYIMDEKLRKEVIQEYKKNGDDPLLIFERYEKLKEIQSLVRQIRSEKLSGFCQICLFDDYHILCILDGDGPRSFQSFLSTVMSNI